MVSGIVFNPFTNHGHRGGLYFLWYDESTHCICMFLLSPDAASMWLCVQWEAQETLHMFLCGSHEQKGGQNGIERNSQQHFVPLPSYLSLPECNEGFISGKLVSATPFLNGPIFKLLFFFCQLLLPWQKFGSIWFNWDLSCWWTDMQTPEQLYIIFFQHCWVGKNKRPAVS